jgi:hypothetical protein
MKTYMWPLVLIAVIAAFTPASPSSAQLVTMSFSGSMQGNSIFPEGTPFTGSFSYAYPQSSAPSGAYLLHSYELTIQGEAFPIPPVSGFLGGSIPVASPSGASWNGAPVNNVFPSIAVSNSLTDSFVVNIDRVYTMQLQPGRFLHSGPVFTLSDSTGMVFQDTSLPNLVLAANQLDGRQIRIGYSVDGGSSSTQTGAITSLVPEPSTYALLAMTAAGALWWARRRR